MPKDDLTGWTVTSLPPGDQEDITADFATLVVCSNYPGFGLCAQIIYSGDQIGIFLESIPIVPGESFEAYAARYVALCQAGIYDNHLRAGLKGEPSR